MQVAVAGFFWSRSLPFRGSALDASRGRGESNLHRQSVSNSCTAGFAHAPVVKSFLFFPSNANWLSPGRSTPSTPRASVNCQIMRIIGKALPSGFWKCPECRRRNIASDPGSFLASASHFSYHFHTAFSLLATVVFHCKFLSRHLGTPGWGEPSFRIVLFYFLTNWVWHVMSLAYRRMAFHHGPCMFFGLFWLVLVFCFVRLGVVFLVLFLVCFLCWCVFVLSFVCGFCDTHVAWKD